MSCDAAAASLAFLLAHAAHAPPDGAAALLIRAADTPAPAAGLPSGGLAREPLYADIVRRASALRARLAAEGGEPPGAAFRGEAIALAALDMRGHFDLAARGVDGDLKCILKGIAQDLPGKLSNLLAAATEEDRRAAREELDALLRDNVEVITAPPAPPV